MEKNLIRSVGKDKIFPEIDYIEGEDYSLIFKTLVRIKSKGKYYLVPVVHRIANLDSSNIAIRKMRQHYLNKFLIEIYHIMNFTVVDTTLKDLYGNFIFKKDINQEKEKVRLKNTYNI